jgi:DnaJ-class molecular chaperone
MSGEGMPKKNIHSEFGDLYAKMIINFPKSLTEE